MSLLKSRRFGSFRIPYSIINEHPETAKEMLKGIIVLSATPRYEFCSIEYIGVSDMFDEVPTGAKAYEYSCVLNKRYVKNDPEDPESDLSILIEFKEWKKGVNEDEIIFSEE